MKTYTILKQRFRKAHPKSPMGRHTFFDLLVLSLDSQISPRMIRTQLRRACANDPQPHAIVPSVRTIERFRAQLIALGFRPQGPGRETILTTRPWDSEKAAEAYKFEWLRSQRRASRDLLANSRARSKASENDLPIELSEADILLIKEKEAEEWRSFYETSKDRDPEYAKYTLNGPGFE